MTLYGLIGYRWHVGHACPDPRKTSLTDAEDYGWNLFAQYAGDNVDLSRCLVSCFETKHIAAAHVQCDDQPDRCISCDQ